MLFEHLTIVGVGLIGGSIGLAAKAHGVADRVTGLGRERKNLELALALGCIDGLEIDLAAAVRSADLVVVCTPVDRIASTILAAAPYCRPGTIFTDGGSTKGNVLAGLEGRLTPAVAYVPAHPLAGSEMKGAGHARADLFRGRLTVLTPTPTSDPAAVARVEAFWRALGSRIAYLSAADHDRALAATSHLPHAVAAGLAAATPTDWLELAAGGFRDTTRIASGDPEMWAAIFGANRAGVLAALDDFDRRMAAFRAALGTGDGAGLARWLTEAKRVRDALGSGNPAEGA